MADDQDAPMRVPHRPGMPASRAAARFWPDPDVVAVLRLVALALLVGCVLAVLR